MRPNGPLIRFSPVLRYRDVPAAVEWLCGTLGFEKHGIITAVDGTIVEARLMFGNDLILLLPARSPERWRGKSRTPAGAEMQSCYLVVDDVDLHYRNAKAAGVEILDLTEYDYGGRGYSCRDPEGYIWDFGTYDPWHPRSEARFRTTTDLMSLRDNVTPPIVIAAVVAAIIAALTAWWALAALPPRAPESGSIEASASLQRLVETGDSRVKEDGRAPR